MSRKTYVAVAIFLLEAVCYVACGFTKQVEQWHNVYAETGRFITVDIPPEALRYGCHHLPPYGNLDEKIPQK